MKFTKETARRALRTFIQAALAYIAVNIALIDFNSDKELIRSGLIGLAVAAFAAGLGAVMNLEKVEDEESEEGEDEEDEENDV